MRIGLESSTLRTTVLPGLGGGIAELALRRGRGWVNLMRPTPERPAGFNDLACYVLAPWSNRIAGAVFEFGGERHALRADWPDGTAIHGDVKSRAFHVLDRSPYSVRLEHEGSASIGRNWPWPYLAQVRYEVDGRQLECEVSVMNRGETPMPAGLGFHPFWCTALDGGESELLLTANAAGRYPCRDMIPTGPARADAVSAAIAGGTRISEHRLDDVFACAGPLKAELAWPRAGVRLRYQCSEALGHLVIYTGLERAQSFACIEPVSMVNDGFNLGARGWEGTGVRVVPPGGRLEARWILEVEG